MMKKQTPKTPKSPANEEFVVTNNNPVQNQTTNTSASTEKDPIKYPDGILSQLTKKIKSLNKKISTLAKIEKDAKEELKLIDFSKKNESSSNSTKGGDDKNSANSNEVSNSTLQDIKHNSLQKEVYMQFLALIESLTSHSETLEQIRTHLTAFYSFHTSNYETVQKRISELEGENELQKQEIEKLNKFLTSETSKKNESVAQAKKSSKSLEEKEAINRSLKDQVAGMKKEQDERIIRFESEKDALNAEIEKLKKEKADLEDSLNKEKQSNKSMSVKSRQVEENFKNFKQDKLYEIDSLKSDAEKKQKSIEDLKKNQEESQQKMVAIQGKCTNAEENENTLKQKVSALEKEKEQIMTTNLNLQTTITNLQQNWQQVCSERHVLLEQSTKQKRAEMDLTQLSEQLQAQISDMTKKLNEAQLITKKSQKETEDLKHSALRLVDYHAPASPTERPIPYYISPLQMVTKCVRMFQLTEFFNTTTLEGLENRKKVLEYFQKEEKKPATFDFGIFDIFSSVLKGISHSGNPLMFVDPVYRRLRVEKAVFYLFSLISSSQSAIVPGVTFSNFADQLEALEKTSVYWTSNDSLSDLEKKKKEVLFLKGLTEDQVRMDEMTRNSLFEPFRAYVEKAPEESSNQKNEEEFVEPIEVEKIESKILQNEKETPKQKKEEPVMAAVPEKKVEEEKLWGESTEEEEKKNEVAASSESKTSEVAATEDKKSEEKKEAFEQNFTQQRGGYRGKNNNNNNNSYPKRREPREPREPRAPKGGQQQQNNQNQTQNNQNEQNPQQQNNQNRQNQNKRRNNNPNNQNFRNNNNNNINNKKKNIYEVVEDEEFQQEEPPKQQQQQPKPQQQQQQQQNDQIIEKVYVQKRVPKPYIPRRNPNNNHNINSSENQASSSSSSSASVSVSSSLTTQTTPVVAAATPVVATTPEVQVSQSQDFNNNNAPKKNNNNNNRRNNRNHNNNERYNFSKSDASESK